MEEECCIYPRRHVTDLGSWDVAERPHNLQEGPSQGTGARIQRQSGGHAYGRLPPSPSQPAMSALRERARHDEVHLQALSIGDAEPPQTPSPTNLQPHERPCCPVGASFERPKLRHAPSPSSPSPVPSPSPHTHSCHLAHPAAPADACTADIGPSGPASSRYISKPGPRLTLSVRGAGTFDVSLKADTSISDRLDIKIGFDESMSLDLSGSI